MHFSIFDSIVSEAASVSLGKSMIRFSSRFYLYTIHSYHNYEKIIPDVTFSGHVTDFIWLTLYNPDLK